MAGITSLQILCCLLGPLAIIGAGFWGWKKHHQVVVRNFTVQFVADREVDDPKWRAASALFAKHGANLDSFYADSGIGSESKMQMFGFLSHHEFVALAIRNHAMDEQVYRYWREANIVDVWKKASTYVHSRREKTGQKNLYSELEWLAQRWTDSSS